MQQENKKYEIKYAVGEMYNCNENFKDWIGLTISWNAKDIGFGELSISFNTKTGEWDFDDEYMSADFCKAVLAKWFDTIASKGEEK